MPTAFTSPAAFRAWLARHGGASRELVLRCFKVHAAARGITYLQALDEALCFGWIDGVRRAFDADSFSVRFTPRKARSYWSAVNTRHYRRLEAEGRVRSPGRSAFAARVNDRHSTRYSFESRVQALSPAYAKRLKANARAWAFYQAQPPWYQRTSAFWVMSAKNEATRERRMAALIADCARGRRIAPLRRPE